MCGRRSLYGKRANNRATGTIKGGSNMENVKIETRDNKATIIIDLGYRGNLSPTGIIPSPFPVGGKRYGKIL